MVASNTTSDFDPYGSSLVVTSDEKDLSAEQAHAKWIEALHREGFEEKANKAQEGVLDTKKIEVIMRPIFERVRDRAASAGVPLTETDYDHMINKLSALGQLADLIAAPDVEDIAINLGHIYAFTTEGGWKHVGPSKEEAYSLRVEMGRNGVNAPTYDSPSSDGVIPVRVRRNGRSFLRNVRISFLAKPISPYGDAITMRVARPPTPTDRKRNNLALLCEGRLPPIPQPVFSPVAYPEGKGVLSPKAANYLLSLMIHGGNLVIAGTTGSGKTFLAQLLLQEMLDYFPKGAIRLFVIEDSQEIVLNGWDGDPETDTGNIVYTVTRPKQVGSSLESVDMYDLVKEALRARPHGIVIGEARGPEAWEFARAASTGHGHSIFTIHATNTETVWSRFLMIARAHESARGLPDYKIAEGFADAVCAIVFIARHPIYGQIITDIAEVNPFVDPEVGLPVRNTLFQYDRAQDRLAPTGRKPEREGYRIQDLGLPAEFFEE
jgi:Flp pilus assembly CpaF family ATPase